MKSSTLISICFSLLANSISSQSEKGLRAGVKCKSRVKLINGHHAKLGGEVSGSATSSMSEERTNMDDDLDVQPGSESPPAEKDSESGSTAKSAKKESKSSSKDSSEKQSSDKEDSTSDDSASSKGEKADSKESKTKSKNSTGSVTILQDGNNSSRNTLSFTLLVASISLFYF